MLVALEMELPGESPDVDAGNHTPVLWERSKCSYSLSHLASLRSLPLSKGDIPNVFPDTEDRSCLKL